MQSSTLVVDAYYLPRDLAISANLTTLAIACTTACARPNAKPPETEPIASMQPPKLTIAPAIFATQSAPRRQITLPDAGATPVSNSGGTSGA